VSEYRTTEHETARRRAVRAPRRTRPGRQRPARHRARRALPDPGEARRGCHGRVYLGEHLKIGRRDAIKVLRDALASDAEAWRASTAAPATSRRSGTRTSARSTTTATPRRHPVPGHGVRAGRDAEGCARPGGPAAAAGRVAIIAQVAPRCTPRTRGIVHRDLKPATSCSPRAATARNRCASSTSTSPRARSEGRGRGHAVRLRRRHAGVHEPRAADGRRGWTGAATSTRWASCSSGC
jgi:hypothetical protein